MEQGEVGCRGTASIEEPSGEFPEANYRILAHLNLLAAGYGPRAPPRSGLSGPIASASVGPRELIYEPVYDDLPWAERA